MHASTHLDRVVERPRDDFAALRIKVEAHDLSRMPQQRVKALAGFDVPEARRVIHRARRHHGPLRVERETHDLSRMATVRMVQVAVLCVPELTRFVE